MKQDPNEDARAQGGIDLPTGPALHQLLVLLEPRPVRRRDLLERRGLSSPRDSRAGPTRLRSSRTTSRWRGTTRDESPGLTENSMTKSVPDAHRNERGAARRSTSTTTSAEMQVCPNKPLQSKDGDLLRRRFFDRRGESDHRTAIRGQARRVAARADEGPGPISRPSCSRCSSRARWPTGSPPRPAGSTASRSSSSTSAGRDRDGQDLLRTQAQDQEGPGGLGQAGQRTPFRLPETG